VNAVPRRYRRLVVLGVVSLLLHVLAIGFIARAPVVARTPSAALAVRLQAAPLPPPAAAASADSAAAAAPLPRPPVRPAARAAPALARAATGASAQEGAGSTPLVEPPGRYRVQVPASATLDYTLTRPDGTQAQVQIAWQTTGMAYTVAADGVAGPMASTGAIGDTGIEPQESRLRRSDGSAVVATFAADGLAIDARRYEHRTGSQDPASMLLQLTGMGLARPDQLRDAFALHVATADGPVVMQFKVTGDEDLATPLGSFMTRHLVQVVPAGAPRLEIWLAPERNWLPVQLRLYASDGTVSTQAITRIEQDEAVPAAL
jgi:hypothetical protein